jgi:hypothetical protein
LQRSLLQNDVTKSFVLVTCLPSDADEALSAFTERGRTYTSGSERLVSRLVGVELALGVCHRVCVSSCHLEGFE